VTELNAPGAWLQKGSARATQHTGQKKVAGSRWSSRSRQRVCSHTPQQGPCAGVHPHAIEEEGLLQASSMTHAAPHGRGRRCQHEGCSSQPVETAVALAGSQ
jgi:hypothetical protein